MGVIYDDGVGGNVVKTPSATANAAGGIVTAYTYVSSTFAHAGQRHLHVALLATLGISSAPMCTSLNAPFVCRTVKTRFSPLHALAHTTLHSVSGLGREDGGSGSITRLAC